MPLIFLIFFDHSFNLYRTNLTNNTQYNNDDDNNKLSNHSKKSISISRCFSSWKTLIFWKTLLQMYSLKGYILPFHRLPFHRLPFHRLPFQRLPFHRLPFHRLPFHVSLSSLQTKSVKVGMFNCHLEMKRQVEQLLTGCLFIHCQHFLSSQLITILDLARLHIENWASEFFLECHFYGCHFMQCLFLQWHFSMPFSESC